MNHERMVRQVAILDDLEGILAGSHEGGYIHKLVGSDLEWRGEGQCPVFLAMLQA